MTEAEKAAEAARIAAEKAAADAAAKAAADAAAEAAAKEAADKAAREAADKAAADEAARKKAEEDAKKTKKPEGMSDNEWKLLRETMERKETIERLQADLKKFEGIDPEKVKALLADKEAAEKAARDAELKKAETEGNFARVREMMAEEHQKVVGQLNTAVQDLKAQLNGKQKTIEDLTVGHQFASDPFVAEELVMPPSVTKSTFGPHFEFKDGTVIGYDQPAGVAVRTVLTGADGKPLSFTEAMKKIVAAHPDKDKLLRDKMKSGTGSTPTAERKKADDKATAGTGASRIAAVLAQRQKAKK